MEGDRGRGTLPLRPARPVALTRRRAVHLRGREGHFRGDGAQVALAHEDLRRSRDRVHHDAGRRGGSRRVVELLDRFTSRRSWRSGCRSSSLAASGSGSVSPVQSPALAPEVLVPNEPVSSPDTGAGRRPARPAPARARACLSAHRAHGLALVRQLSDRESPSCTSARWWRRGPRKHV